MYIFTIKMVDAPGKTNKLRLIKIYFSLNLFFFDLAVVK